MTTSDAARKLEDLAREVDLLVYRLEVADRQQAEEEVARTRRELERLKESLEDLARGLS